MSIAPEKLTQAILLQVLYSIRSELHLVEQNSCNRLFKLVVILSIAGVVLNYSIFSKKRDRLFKFDVVKELFNETTETRPSVSGDNLSVDGTLT